MIACPNAGLVFTHLRTYYYRNGSLISSSTAVSSAYGGTANGDGSADIKEILYVLGQYRLGAFQLGTSSNPNHFWIESPICTQLGYPVTPLDLYDFSATYTAVKPTITGPGNSSSASLWYLGGAPSIDGFYVQTTLTGQANWGSGPPVAWLVIQRPDKASLSASVASQVTVTSQGANASTVPFVYDQDVLVQASTDGLPSDPYPLSINAPWSASGTLDLNYDYPGSQGYISRYSYRLYDVAGFQITVPITLHETIEHCLVDYPSASWCDFAPSIDTWTPSEWYISNGEWLWADSYAAFGFLYPSPAYPQAPLGTTAVINKTQKFFVGSPGDPGRSANIFSGLCVQRDKIQFYQDHGEKQLVLTPAPVAACAAGAYAN